MPAGSEFFFRRSPFRNGIAFVLSAVTSPYVIIPLLSLWIVARYSATREQCVRWTLISIFFTTVIPFADVVIEIWRGKITDIHVKVREERMEPFIVAIVSSLVGTVLLYADGAPMEIVALGCTVVVNGAAFATLCFFTKASIHIAVLTVGIFAIGYLVHPLYYFIYVVMPVVIWGRIYRKRHSVWEAALAMIVALAVTWGVLNVFHRMPT